MARYSEGIIQATNPGDMIDPNDFEIESGMARGIVGGNNGGYFRVDELGYRDLESQYGLPVEYPLHRVPIHLTKRSPTDRDPVRNPKAYAVGKFLAKRKKKAGSAQKTTKKKRGGNKTKGTKKRGGKR